jgi:hypothetical protein
MAPLHQMPVIPERILQNLRQKPSIARILLSPPLLILLKIRSDACTELDVKEV